MKKFLVNIALVLFLATGCVPDNKFSGSTGTGTTATPIPSVYSVASCAQVGAFTTLNECVLSTNAQCTASTQVVQGSTTVCYTPISGWQACTPTSAAWTYGTWGNWCYVSNGIYQRSRSATCVRSNPVCECITDSQAIESCTNNNTANYTACTSLPTSMLTCSGAPTPTPTPAPTPVCSTGILNYIVSGTNSESILTEVKNSNTFYLSNYFNARGYYWNRTRSNSTNLASSAITATEKLENYEIRVMGWQASCSYGRTVTVGIYLYRAGVLKASTSQTSACVPTYLGTSSAMSAAVSNLVTTNCQ